MVTTPRDFLWLFTIFYEPATWGSGMVAFRQTPWHVQPEGHRRVRIRRPAGLQYPQGLYLGAPVA